MVIREASKADIPVIMQILRDASADVAQQFNLTIENCPKNPAFCTESRIDDDFARGLYYYLLEQDGKPCGCVAIEKASDEVCYLERLAVLPEFRQQGLGAALVSHVLETARAMGMQQVDIGIISEHTKLKNWYGKFGFVLKDTRHFEHLPFTVAFMAAAL